MDVFLMIRRKKTTVFMDAKESTPVLEMKRMLQGITKKLPEDMRLFKDDQTLEDHKTLGDCGFTSSTARAQAPATIGLSYKLDDGDFEPLEVAPLSTPPELPDVMKPTESTSAHKQEQTAPVV
ncbi:Elongin-B [Lamellibrachia satsuma]|nr:Elongin-B [Lamellibrachia satsuma]